MLAGEKVSRLCGLKDEGCFMCPVKHEIQKKTQSFLAIVIEIIELLN